MVSGCQHIRLYDGTHHSPIPVVARAYPQIADKEDERLEQIASRLLRDEPALSQTSIFGPNVSPGIRNGPLLIIGDRAAISLVSSKADLFYQYRLALLAREGDLVVLPDPPAESFEDYLREFLKLGAIKPLRPTKTQRSRRRNSLARACLADRSVFRTIVRRTRKVGCLTIVPHISFGDIWVLAGAIASASGCPVSVAGPPPRLSLRANHKVWFAQLVDQVLGRQAQPTVNRAFGPAALTGDVAAFARRHSRIIVKVPDSAGSAGNISIESSKIVGKSAAQLQAMLLALLAERGWAGNYPLLVQVWDQSVTATPSAQLWIPETAEGMPIVEGVFEQVVVGREGKFVGSVPASLAADVADRFAREAFQLARVLQQCGYVGRCSFDAVIVGNGKRENEIHWIECNGRWGGVSIPMTLVNRLFPIEDSKAFVVVQRRIPSAKALPFPKMLQRIGEQLLKPGETTTGVVVLSPAGQNDPVLSVHYAAIGETKTQAFSMAESVLLKLTAND